MQNSEDVHNLLVPIVVAPTPVPVTAPLSPSQDTTSDQVAAFYRPHPIPFVRHAPLPPSGQSQMVASGKSVSQTQSGRAVYGKIRNLNQIPAPIAGQGIAPTVGSNNQTVTKTLRNLPTTYTLTGSWTNPQNAIDNDPNTFAEASSTTANIVYLATVFPNFANWFTSNLLQVTTYVVAVTGGSVIVEYSTNSGTSWTNMRTVSSADSIPVVSQVPLALSIPTGNVQVRITLPGSATGTPGMASAYAGTGANDATVGTAAWSNPSNATGSSTSTFASVSYTDTNNNETTEYLKLTNYGFSVPAGATINGIAASIYEKGNSATNSDILPPPYGDVSWGQSVQDFSVKLYKGGTITGADRALGSNWPNVASAVSYGGTTDLWGTTWTAADINGSGFGIGISANLTVFTSNPHVPTTTAIAAVYYAQITVYYTTTTGTSSSTTRIYDIAQLTTL